MEERRLKNFSIHAMIFSRLFSKKQSFGVISIN
jgi:hypothetical protein